MGNFKITDQKGFHLTFDNGITLSTQFGPGNYCEHHPAPLSDSYTVTNLDAPREEDVDWESRDVEIAIWDEDRTCVTQEMFKDLFPSEVSHSHEAQVKGWVEMEDWLKVLDWCRNY